MPLSTQAARLEMSPMRFYALTGSIMQIGEREVSALRRAEDKIFTVLTEIERQVLDLGKASHTLNQEVRLTTRRNRSPFEVEDEGLDELLHTASGHTFINLAFDVLHTVEREAQNIHELLQDLRPGDLILTKKKHDPKDIEDFGALEHMLLEFQLNKPTIDKFINSVMRLRTCRASVYDRAMAIERALDVYYQKLQDRHTVQGIEIHIDPVVTDVAMSVYENVDSHGEIQDGKDPKELSAYSVRKATIIADAVKKGPIHDLIENPKSLTGKVAEYLKQLWTIAAELAEDWKESVKRVEEACDVRQKHSKEVTDRDFFPI